MAAPLQNFDWTLLDNSAFKEDAVREEIITPLLHAVGYAPSGRFNIQRSAPLTHPYVALGSVRRAIKIYPDYLLRDWDRVICVLDAKAPSESVDDPDHLQQVYTYAIHRDVRADWYAVCNGHAFSLFSVADMGTKPQLCFSLTELSERWEDVQRGLAGHSLGTLRKSPSLFESSRTVLETREATTAFDVLHDVATFAHALTAEGAILFAQHDAQLEPTRTAAGGRFSTRPIEVTHWWTLQKVVNFRDDGGTEEEESTYLVRWPLVFGFHRGYAIEQVVVALVDAKLMSSYARPIREEFKLAKATLTLRFRGFLDQIPARLPAGSSLGPI